MPAPLLCRGNAQTTFPNDKSSERKPDRVRRPQLGCARSPWGSAADSRILSRVASGTATVGSELPQPVRGEMEQAFGRDLSDVRLHSDSSAAGLSGNLHAQAFAYRNHIFFGASRYVAARARYLTRWTFVEQRPFPSSLVRSRQRRGKESSSMTDIEAGCHGLHYGKKPIMSCATAQLGNKSTGELGEFTMGEKLRNWRIGLIRRCKGGC